MKVGPAGNSGDVVLLPLLPDDVTEEYVNWLRDPEVTKFTEVQPGETLGSARAYVKAAVSAPDAAIWRIKTESGTHVGNIRLSRIRFEHRRAEVALIIGNRSYWGRGVGSKAIQLVSEYAFDRLDLRKLTAGILAPNIGSRRAFEKAGFVCEATLRGHYMLGGKACDYSILARFQTPRSVETAGNGPQGLRQ